ncbi:MAG: hypothetical protein ABUS49_09870, partial [Acidobacteriota bacterium]
PDRYLMVLDGSVPDFKPTSLRFLDRAHALVVTSDAALAWPGVPASLLAGKTVFRVNPPSYETRDLSESLRLCALTRGSLPAQPGLAGD